MAHQAGKFSACVLTLGDRPELLNQFCGFWYSHSSKACPLRIGVNRCSTSDAPVFADISPLPSIYTAAENLGKPAMMRRLFYDPPIETEWTIWFDDDSFPYRADWLQSLEIAIAVQPDAMMFGIPMVTHICSRMAEFIRQAPWYRGVPLRASDQAGAAARLDFILGGFWAIKTSWIYRLDWPDRRIVHFEDDYLLGEAIRQHGGKFGRFRSGVKVDTAPRRAPAGMPATLDVWQSQP